MNRRRKMILYRKSPRYLDGMRVAGILQAVKSFVGNYFKDNT